MIEDIEGQAQFDADMLTNDAAEDMQSARIWSGVLTSKKAEKLAELGMTRWIYQTATRSIGACPSRAEIMDALHDELGDD